MKKLRSTDKAESVRLNSAPEIAVAGDLVTVVIVNYNAGELLIDCVKSIIDRASEVIIVDNASTDSSMEACEQFFRGEEKLASICNDVNFGFSAACNQGILAGQCNNFLFLNPDCTLGVGVLDELLTCLRADARVGMVGGLLVNRDGSEQAGGRRAIPTPWRSFVRAFGLSHLSRFWPRLFSDFYLHEQPLPSEPIEVEAISGACMLVKRETIEDVGVWDEGYFLHCEDLDWCMRLQQKEWKIMFVPTAPITHALGVCSKKRKVFVEWHKHKGMIRFYNKFFRKEYPGPLMGLVVLGVALRFIFVAGYFTVQRLRGL
ncbi:MAG: glycosyltransferase family 2 protein [Gammaproteobacteria bacterium]|nr:MAG: glycosyltransferase family 2 protein [Gammaproteobacteria bacterium]